MKHFLVKTILLICTLAAVLSAQTPVKNFRCEPDNYCGPSGGVASTILKVQVEDGYKLLGWDIKILRKNAPDSFFAQSHRTSHCQSLLFAENTRLLSH